MPDETQMTLINVVFERRHNGTSAKYGYEFRRLGEDGKITDGPGSALYFTFKKKITPAPVAGGVYQIGTFPDGTYRILLDNGRMRYLRQYPHDRAYVNKLILDDDTFDLRQRMQRNESAARKAEPIAEMLAPIIALYQQTDALGKRVIETEILRILHRY